MGRPPAEDTEFRFLGQSYRISCPCDNQVLLELAAERLQQQLDILARKNTPMEKQAMFSALLFAFDLMRQNRELQSLVDELRDLREELLQLNTMAVEVPDHNSTQSEALKGVDRRLAAGE